jgi:hypothetical protein
MKLCVFIDKEPIDVMKELRIFVQEFWTDLEFTIRDSKIITHRNYQMYIEYDTSHGHITYSLYKTRFLNESMVTKERNNFIKDMLEDYLKCTLYTPDGVHGAWVFTI